VSTDAIIRLLCVAAAAALALAPYQSQIRSAAERAAEAVWQHHGVVTKLLAIGLLIGAAWGHVTIPALSIPSVAVTVETPSADMQAKVAPILTILKTANGVDRAIWASVWDKAASTVAGDASAPEIAFTDTRSLRGFTVLALDIAWRRLGGNMAGKYPGLREATEKALSDVVGLDVMPVTADLRARYAEVARAIAWAGTGKG